MLCLYSSLVGCKDEVLGNQITRPLKNMEQRCQIAEKLKKIRIIKIIENKKMNKQLEDGQIILQIPENLFPQFEKAYKKFLEADQKEQKLMDKLTLYFLDKFEQWLQQNDHSNIVLECEKVKANTNVEYKDLKSLVKENQSNWGLFLQYCQTTQFKSSLHLKGLKILIRDFDILQEKQQREFDQYIISFDNKFDNHSTKNSTQILVLRHNMKSISLIITLNSCYIFK
ncbi:hypothetical protein pb186bvf_009775 [Paramecium bursaria]